MYSKARVAGHAIHPMLVGFPIALFTATIGLELAHIGTGDAFYFRAAMIANIAGLVMGALAAIPGLIDRNAINRKSRARDLANSHAAFNLLTLAAFACSGALLAYGWSTKTMVDGAYALDLHIPLALDLIGFVAMASAAMLGFTLVQTHHVGIKPARIYAQKPSRAPELDTGAFAVR